MLTNLFGAGARHRRSAAGCRPFSHSQWRLNLSALLGCADHGFWRRHRFMLISKPMAKWSPGLRVHRDNPRTRTGPGSFSTVQKLADKAGIGMPEVRHFEGQTPTPLPQGPSKNSALLAVSDSLLRA